MNVIVSSTVLAMLVLTPACARAIDVPVPSDVAVTLSATPGTDLVPGELIDFTLTVSNLGPQPVDRLQIASSDMDDSQIDLSTLWTDCKVMMLTVVDTTTSYFYYLSWYPTDVAVLAVGEARTCHLKFALHSAAPAILPFQFGMPSYYVDINPANNVGKVLLTRLIASVPAQSPALLLVLAALLAIMGTVFSRSRSTGRASDADER